MTASAIVVQRRRDRERLTQVAPAVYDQMEKNGGLNCVETAVGHASCPNSDIENLESKHRRVSLSHRVITRN